MKIQFLSKKKKKQFLSKLNPLSCCKYFGVVLLAHNPFLVVSGQMILWTDDEASQSHNSLIEISLTMVTMLGHSQPRGDFFKNHEKLCSVVIDFKNSSLKEAFILSLKFHLTIIGTHFKTKL